MSELKEKYRKYLDKKANYKAWYRFFYGFFYILGKTLFPGKALGVENLPEKGGYILAFNHRSWKDVPLSYYAVPGYRHFLAKEEMYNSKFARWIFPKMGAIAVDREKIDLSTIRKISKVLRDGEVLGIFPEGTRNKENEDEMLQFKNGAALFALQAKVPVLPVYIYKKPRFFKRNYIYIGKPLYPYDYVQSGPASAEKVATFGNVIRDGMEEARLTLDRIVENKEYKKTE